MYKTALAFTLVASFASTAHGITFTTLDAPLGAQGTKIYGVSGNNAVGSYTDSSGTTHGFLYNGSTFTTLDAPLAEFGTYARAISGNTVVGSYQNSIGGYGLYGFIYDGSTYQTVYGPTPGSPDFAVLTGIDGNRIVGYTDLKSLIYTGSTLTTIEHPSAQDGTYASGISGDTIIGAYATASAWHGFLYKGSTFTNFDDPLAASGGTRPQGISGSNIVGFYFDSAAAAHGFFYNGSAFTTLDNPLAGHSSNNGTFINGISGNEIVGYYIGSQGVAHGFIATIPEPSSIAMLGVGAMGLAVVACRRMRQQRRK